MVKNGNFTLPLTPSGQEWQYDTATNILVQEEWQFLIVTDIYLSGMVISYYYWQLLVKGGNLTLLLTSSGLELTISQIVIELVVIKKGKFTLLMTSSVEDL